jgi:hypothetical protein
VVALLRAEDFPMRLGEWREFPARQVINPLLACLCSPERVLKWHAVTAIGVVVATLADADRESARVIMRRLIWTLNDESGGIGWGAPEAMGEILASHEVLAGEYYRILLSYIREDGNRLENPILQRGVLWGLARLAETRPHLLEDAPVHVFPFLHSPDAATRASALRLLGLVGKEFVRPQVELLINDAAETDLYVDACERRVRVAAVAADALERLARPGAG